MTFPLQNQGKTPEVCKGALQVRVLILALPPNAPMI